MAQGFLHTKVANEADMSPIHGARVVVRDLADNILFDTSTDERGQSPIMTLAAPDAALTLDPNFRGRPYAQYIMEVSKYGFHSMIIRYIEVLSGQTSIQPVMIHRASPEEIAQGITIQHIIETGSRQTPGAVG